MSRFYNGFVIQGNLTPDQKRSLSMTKRSLERKGIRFADSSSVGEPVKPIKPAPFLDLEQEKAKYAPERRLTMEETAAMNAKPVIRTTRKTVKTPTKMVVRKTRRVVKSKVNTFYKDIIGSRVHCAMGAKGQPFRNDHGQPCVRRFTPNGSGSVDHHYHTFAS